MFPTLNGVELYKAKVQTPYYQLYVTNTPYSVKSRGIKSQWYVFSTFQDNPSLDSGHEVFSGTGPLLKWYSGRYFPDEVSQYYNTKQQFGVKYTGNFIPATSTGTVYLMGTGKAKVVIGGNSSATLDLNTYARASLSLSSLTPNAANSLTITYNSLKKGVDFHTFVVTVKENGELKPIVLSAGKVNHPTDTTQLTTKNLPDISSVELSIDDKLSRSLTFQIPIVSSISSLGYEYIANGNYFRSTSDSSISIKRFNYIEYHVGYKYGSGTIATMTRFVGQINDWSISRDTNNDAVRISCSDWFRFPQSEVNEGYPNISDYLAHDYLQIDKYGVNGKNKPRTYDGWALYDVVENLFLNSNVDPVLLRKKKKEVSVDTVEVDGYYNFYEYNSPQPVYMDLPLKYGNPNVLNISEADDKYIWQFSIGDNLYDNMTKVLDNYGLRYYFNNKGEFVSESINNPVNIKGIDQSNYSSSVWSEVKNTKALYGVAVQANTNGATITATFQGRLCEIIVGVGSGYGTIHVKLSNPTLGIVATTDFSLNNTITRYFFDGVDLSTGTNNTKLTVGIGNKYGTYSLNITSKAVGTIIYNGVLVYDKDIYTAKDEFYTGKVGSNYGRVSRMDINSDSNDIRNDVVVIGRLLGFDSRLSLGEDQNPQIYNPNNPIENRVISRTVDINSIASLSYSEFVGRKLQTVIIEPEIATESRAAWLSYETLTRYNRNDKVISVGANVKANPLLNVGDLVKFKELKYETIGTNVNFYVSNINEYASTEGFISQIVVNTFKPWSSYFKYPIPSAYRFGNNPFSNVRLYNTGLPFSSESRSGRTVFYEKAASTLTAMFQVDFVNVYNITETSYATIERMIPAKGYIKYGSEVLKYTDRSVSLGPIGPHSTSFNFNVKYKNITGSMYNSTEVSDPDSLALKPMLAGVSPYITEEFGILPAVEYSLLFPGYVRVTVRSEDGTAVDVLTGNTQFGATDGWEYREPGSYYDAWGIIDRSGVYNENNHGRFERSGSPISDQPHLSISVLGAWQNYHGPANDTYRIGGGYYASNRIRDRVGKFYFDVEYLDNTNIIFSGSKVLANKTPITTHLFIDGQVALSDQTLESIYINNKTDLVRISGTPTLMWSQSQAKNLTGNGSFGSLYRQYYTGEENSGQGIIIPITNAYNKRIVNAGIKRYTFLFVDKYYDVFQTVLSGQKQWVRNSHKVAKHPYIYVEDILTKGKETFIIDSTQTNGILVPPPENFLTPQMRTDIENILKLNQFQEQQVVHYLAISQLHVFVIDLEDQSGRRDSYKFSIWYIGKGFDYTQAEWARHLDSGDPFSLQNNYDFYHPNPHEKVLLLGYDKEVAGNVVLEVDSLSGDIPNVAKNGGYNSNYNRNISIVSDVGIFGVTLLGKGR